MAGLQSKIPKGLVEGRFGLFHAQPTIATLVRALAFPIPKRTLARQARHGVEIPATAKRRANSGSLDFA